MVSNSVLWLLAGAVLFAVEAFGLPGIGFLFAAIGAVIAGIAIELGLIGMDDIIAQWAVFFIATTFFAVLLWKKIKAWRLDPNAPHYSNILGTEATVIGTLTEGGGSVKWSGTTMRAKLASGSGTANLGDGAAVVVTAVDGNVLTVVPK